MIYYTRKLRYFVLFLDFVPGIRDQQGQKLDPSELKELRLESASERDCLLAALNSGGVGKVTDQSAADRSPVHAGEPARLRELGYDEIWLQNWLAADPTRLGLGEVTILAQELTSPRGGSLDILAASADGDTYYSVEVQLGEIDASHGFRVFDYWAMNRARSPGKTHIAVLMAESASGRYRPALEALAEYLPLLITELRVWRGAGEAIIVPETVIANESLDIAGPAGRVGQERTRDDWVSEATDEALRFVEEFVNWTQQNLGEVRVDYSPQSYIGVRRGRRVWAPLWLRADGAMVYLPDPDGSREEQASVAFDYFVDRLRGAGLEPGWQRTYNAGANPIALRLRRADLPNEQVQELLRASFEILDPGASPFSERGRGSRQQLADHPTDS